MIDLILQAPTPTTGLPNDWAIYIIGGLVSGIIGLVWGIKWLVGLASSKVDKIVDRVETMHTSGITQLTTVKDSMIKQELKLNELDNDIKETKYAIQTLNTKVKCVEK